MSGLAHQLAAGFAAGGIYASVALALVVIYRATRQVNFAQGEMATLSCFIAWRLIAAGVPYWIAFAVTVLLSFLLGVMIELTLMRRVADAPMLTRVGVSVGLMLMIGNATGWIFGYEPRAFPALLASPTPLLAGIVSSQELATACATLTTLLLVWAFFRFTKLGLAMRAAAYNPQAAQLVGVPVGMMVSLGWGLAATVGAVAGMVVAPVLFLEPSMMLGVLLYAFAGALLGGIDSPAGAVVGGYAVAMLESLAGAYVVGTELKLTVALAVIVGVLIRRPAGLFGRLVVDRV